LFSLFYKEFPTCGELIFILYLDDGMILRTFMGICISSVLPNNFGVINGTFWVQSLRSGLKKNFSFSSPYIFFIWSVNKNFTVFKS